MGEQKKLQKYRSRSFLCFKHRLMSSEMLTAVSSMQVFKPQYA